MHAVNLENSLDSVSDEETFLHFLVALAADRADEVGKEKISPSSPYSPGVNGWENGSIEAFLEAAAAWGEDSKDGMPFQISGLPTYEKPTNPWKRCGEIIYMGKLYE